MRRINCKAPSACAPASLNLSPLSTLPFSHMPFQVQAVNFDKAADRPGSARLCISAFGFLLSRLALLTYTSDSAALKFVLLDYESSRKKWKESLASSSARKTMDEAMTGASASLEQARTPCCLQYVILQPNIFSSRCKYASKHRLFRHTSWVVP